MSLRAPIFLLGAHKSGTSLLRSLLDDHPALWVIPTETHFFQATGSWVDYRLRRAWPRALDRSAMVAALVDLIDAQNRHEDRFADSVLVGRFDVAALRRHLEATPWTSRAELLAAYLDGLHRALHGGVALPGDRRIVEKSVENAEWAPVLAHWFADARFVHIVRNPYAALVAIRRAKSEGGRFPNLTDAALSLRSNLHALFVNREALPAERHLVIRYEDLVADVGPVMAKVAAHLGIGAAPSLERPTLEGKPWAGNSSRGVELAGVSKAPAEAWRDDITDLEIRIVNAVLGPVVEALGYPRLTARGLLWAPAPGESARTLVKNRALLWWA